MWHVRTLEVSAPFQQQAESWRNENQQLSLCVLDCVSPGLFKFSGGFLNKVWDVHFLLFHSLLSSRSPKEVAVRRVRGRQAWSHEEFVVSPCSPTVNLTCALSSSREGGAEMLVGPSHAFCWCPHMYKEGECLRLKLGRNIEASLCVCTCFCSFYVSQNSQNVNGGWKI